MTQVDETTLTPFSEVMNSLEIRGGAFGVKIPPDWLQGRTAYGGLSAALCLQATLCSFEELPPLRSTSFTFLAPATGQLLVTAELVRQGRTMTFSRAEVAGELGAATHATFSFGRDRPSEYRYLDLTSPVVARPETYPPYFTWQDTPAFMKHFEGRIINGVRPGTPSEQPEILVWLRHRDRGSRHTLVGLVALADALPPAIFARFQAPVPISTVTWSADFLDDEHGTDDGWYLVRSVAESAANGFSTQVISVWASDGRPLMSARQNVAIFGDAVQVV